MNAHEARLRCITQLKHIKTIAKPAETLKHRTECMQDVFNVLGDVIPNSSLDDEVEPEPIQSCVSSLKLMLEEVGNGSVDEKLEEDCERVLALVHWCCDWRRKVKNVGVADVVAVGRLHAEIMGIIVSASTATAANSPAARKCLASSLTTCPRLVTRRARISRR